VWIDNSEYSGTRNIARKPPLSDTLLWATPSLAHPFKIEVILSKRVDVLPKQRGREAQNIVVDHLAFSAELADYKPDVGLYLNRRLWPFTALNL
jgi:hypothetical protein